MSDSNELVYTDSETNEKVSRKQVEETIESCVGYMPQRYAFFRGHDQTKENIIQALKLDLRANQDVAFSYYNNVNNQNSKIGFEFTYTG
ncbi:hypothetical protein H4219_005223 [Mycoemilia scoparia]|uniref:Uncharacterized protein n=1 Tax=Mycoemilia scoparia TaxID=417184 RepID=A0A9W7ZYG3_9FUNG|nr:hypothetical protein H4219_005223 [Mycoemilia scoparia]